MERKYELLKDDAIDVYGHTLYRIKALRNFGNIKAGDLGGYIEKEVNLSHEGKCWVSGDAWVCDNVRVYDNALICDTAWVCDSAQIFDNAWVFGNAIVCNNAVVSSNAKVCGYARVYGDAKVSNNACINSTNDYICIGPIGSRNGYTTFYLTKDKTIMVKCGCFNNTLEEFVKAVNETHKDNEKYKKQYIDAVKYAVEYLKDDKGGN